MKRGNQARIREGEAIRRSHREVSRSLTVNDGALRHKIIKDFTTSTVDYDLFQDTSIRNALLQFATEEELTEGIDLNITVLIDTKTQVKINNQSEYNDFLADTVFDICQTINSVKIKDSGITGQIEVIIND